MAEHAYCVRDLNAVRSERDWLVKECVRLREALSEACDWLDAPDFLWFRYRNPHATRHTFATSFLRGRGRLETLKLILGHESIQTTSDLYGHLDMRDVAADMGLLAPAREE